MRSRVTATGAPSTPRSTPTEKGPPAPTARTLAAGPCRGARLYCRHTFEAEASRGRDAAQDPARRVAAADAVVQRRPGSAEPAAATASPGNPAAGRSRRPGAAVPDGPHPPGGQHGAVRRHPGRGARRLQALAALTAVPGAPAGEGAGHTGPDLLQVRG